jgi:hypothetical protein
MAPSALQLVLFIGVGLTITTVIERLATNGYWLQSWT